MMSFLTPARVVFGTLGAAVVYALWRNTMKRKVFISYDHSEDVRYRQLLSAWDANSEFDFTFDDRSPATAIDSTDAARIKAALTAMMRSADYLLVIVGEKSYTSKWMTWEIDRAKQPDIKLKLAAVKINRDYATPPGLLNVGTSWAYSFTRGGIIDALSKAKSPY